MIVAIATVKRLFTIFAGVNISKGILFFKIYTSLILSFKFNWNNLKDNNFVLFYEEKWQCSLHSYLITAITKVPRDLRALDAQAQIVYFRIEV